MNMLFIVLLVVVAGMTVLGALTTNGVGRAVVIGTILVTSVIFSRLHDTAMARFQAKYAAPPIGIECEKLRAADQISAHERLGMSIKLMFASSAALAIIAAIPRRRKP